LFGRVELFHRQHRRYAVPQFEHRRTVYPRRAAVSDCIFVAGLEFHRKIERLSRRHVAQEQLLAREARHRAATKTEVRHRNPGSELTGGFSHEARRKARQVHGNCVASCRAHAWVQLRDPVDEREGAEPLGHSGASRARCLVRLRCALYAPPVALDDSGKPRPPSPAPPGNCVWSRMTASAGPDFVTCAIAAMKSD
jgi:hypothetical protein